MPVHDITAEIDGQVHDLTLDIPDGMTVESALVEYKRGKLLGGPPEKGSAIYRFGRGLYETTLKPLPGMVKELTRPPTLGEGPIPWMVPPPAARLVSGVVQAGIETGKKAFAPGLSPIQRVGYGAASLLPFVGPPAAQAGETMREDLPRGLGQATGLLAPFAATSLLPKSLPVRPVIKNVLNPTEQAAIAAAKARGIPVTPGQATGQMGLQRLEQSLTNLPGSATRAGKFYADQQAALATEGERLAQLPSRVGTDPYGAGSLVAKRGESTVLGLKGQADVLYDKVRAALAQATEDKIVGYEDSKLLDLRGNPVPGPPIIHTFQAPIDIANLQAPLGQVYQDLKRSMPVARREASPAFAALDDIMKRRTGPPGVGAISERYMNAADFDKALGAIKHLTRGGDSPYLSTVSQGIAKRIIQAGEAELKQAMSKAGPDAITDLQAGRAKVKRYHEIDDLFADLPKEPEQLYQRMTRGKDAIYDTLTEVSKIAPAETKVVARTFLEELASKATSEGGFSRAAGVMADWNRLGDRTKDLLFGARQTQDLDNFMLAAKRLTSVRNPSESAGMAIAFGSAGAATAALWAALTGHIWGAGGAAGIAGGLVVAPNIVSRVLFTSGGARLLTAAITLPVNSLGFKASVHALNARFATSKELPSRPQLPSP